MSALQPALGRLSEMELRPNQIVAHNTELEDAMNEALSNKWGETRGLKVVSIALGSVTLPDEDAAMIKELQKNAVLQNPNMAAATLVGAQAEAMKTAAGNTAGAMTGFMGMGMANTAGGVNAQNLYAMGQQYNQQQQQNNQSVQQSNQPAQSLEWTCECGAQNTGKFCSNCGNAKPEVKTSMEWTCECGTQNTGKFCTNCGKPQPAAEWQCSCGTVNSGKFCSNCGASRV